MNKCENCKKKHSGEYGSGRFCSGKCARGFSTKEKRKEINNKVSMTLSNKLHDGLTTQQVIQRRLAEKHASYLRKIEATSLLDLSKRTVSKILKRMNLPCSRCGWHVSGAICDIHHILPRKKGGVDSHDNLTYICPNCHRLAHSNLLNVKELINLNDYIGDSWKQYYFVKTSS